MSACFGDPNCNHESHKNSPIAQKSLQDIKSEDFKPVEKKTADLHHVLLKVWGNKPKGKAFRKWRNSYLKMAQNG